MKDIARVAVIDIGTYSIKLTIAEKDDVDINILEALKNVVPLGNDTFFNGRISHETTNQTVSILLKYKQKLQEYSVSTVKVVTTTAVREAENRDIFIDTIFRETGFILDVLTAGDIIYYFDSYLYRKLKDSYPLHDKSILIAELGSGSIDVAFMDKGFTYMNAGLPLGTLRLNQMMQELGGSTIENCEAITDRIENELAYLKRDLPQTDIDDVILIDESYASYLPGILPDKNLTGKFYALNNENISLLNSIMLERTPSLIAKEFKVPAGNAATFLEYSMILKQFANLSKKGQVYMLEASLSEAILANIIMDYENSPKYNKANQLVSIAKILCVKYRMDLNHIESVVMLSSTLFENFKELLGLKKTDWIYLLLAAYLHDIGMFVGNRSHHKHSEYIISNLNLFRLTQEEIKIIACIARYHRRGTPAKSHLLYNSLAKDKQILILKLSALLRIANALDRSHKQKVNKLEIKLLASQAVITAHTQQNFENEILEFGAKKGLFEEISGKKLELKVRND